METRELLTPSELAKMLKLTVLTLTRWRKKEIGPRYIALPSGSIRYSPREVANFLKALEKGE